MIFNDCYSTTVGSVFVTKQIETAIKQAIIKDNLNNMSLNVDKSGKYKPVFITGRLPSESEIPVFIHPIMIFNSGQWYLCTDLRMYVKSNTDGPIEESIKNLTEFNFVKSKAILNLCWLNDGVDHIKNTLSFASTVFSAWLSETISRAFALDFKDQTTIAIITSFYYQTLFTNETLFNEDSKQRMAVHTIKATKAPAELVFSIFDKLGPISNINDYCSEVERLVENVRLKNFNLAILLTIIKNSWYGTNAKEVLSVSIEHPPTWVALVYTALTERTYKNSSIYKFAEKFGKRGMADEFLASYKLLVKELTIAKEDLIIKDIE